MMSITEGRSVFLIAAYDNNRGIGHKGELLYRISDDQRRFAHLTAGSVLIMGRKTFESLPRMLKGRTHIVLTNESNYADLFGWENVPNLYFEDTMEGALELADSLCDKEEINKISIIGGSGVYSQSLPYINRAFVTHIDASHKEADTFINPDFFQLMSTQFTLTKSVEKVGDGLAYTFLNYIKTGVIEENECRFKIEELNDIGHVQIFNKEMGSFIIVSFYDITTIVSAKSYAIEIYCGAIKSTIPTATEEEREYVIGKLIDIMKKKGN